MPISPPAPARTGSEQTSPTGAGEDSAAAAAAAAAPPPPTTGSDPNSTVNSSAVPLQGKKIFTQTPQDNPGDGEDRVRRHSRLVPGLTWTVLNK